MSNNVKATGSFINSVLDTAVRFLDWFYEKVFIQRRKPKLNNSERYQNIMGAIDDVKREVGETREVVVRQNEKLAALQDQIGDLKDKIEDLNTNGSPDIQAALATIATDLDNIQSLATQEELPPTENPGPSEPTSPAEQPQPSA